MTNDKDQFLCFPGSPDHGDAASNLLAAMDEDFDFRWHYDIHPRAEFHQSDLVAHIHIVAFFLPEDHTTSEDSGYLAKNYRDISPPNGYDILLVFD
jgi:hypothetical protein